MPIGCRLPPGAADENVEIDPFYIHSPAAQSTIARSS